MEGIKNFLLHKLTLRVAYIVAAFSSAKIIAFASSDAVQTALQQAGVTFQVHDPSLLKTWISGFVLVAGEVVYHWTHKKVILPQVAPKSNAPPIA